MVRWRSAKVPPSSLRMELQAQSTVAFVFRSRLSGGGGPLCEKTAKRQQQQRATAIGVVVVYWCIQTLFVGLNRYYGSVLGLCICG